MSWAAHDLEPYVINKELGKRVAFVPLLVGSYAPIWPRSGSCTGSRSPASSSSRQPARFHRGWPGFGFTHSLAFGVLIGLLLYAIWRKRTS